MSLFKFDTHMHLDLYKNRDEIIKHIEKEKSYTIAMTNLPILFEKYINLYNNLKYIKFALGFHPELVCEYQNQLPIFLKNLNRTRYIGEIGLDYTVKDEMNKSVQREVFTKIINECSNFGDKILSVHSRKAVKDVIELIGNFNGKVILHWFTGSSKELQKSIENGYYFSVNHQMIKNKSGQKLISEMPLERILVESDAPFTLNLKEVYSTSFMDIIIRYLSIQRKISENKISVQLKNNFKDILIN